MMGAKTCEALFLVAFVLSFYVDSSFTKECNASSFNLNGGYLRYLGTLPELPVFTLCRYFEADADGLVLGVMQSYSTDKQLNAFLNYGVKSKNGFDIHLNIGDQRNVIRNMKFPANSGLLTCQIFDTVEGKIYRNLNGNSGPPLIMNNMKALPGGGELLIGKSLNDSMDGYKGKVSGIMIWERKLSDEEIVAIMNNNVCPDDTIVDIQLDSVQPYGRFIQQEECKSSDFTLANSDKTVHYVEYTGAAPSLRSATICAWVTTANDGSVPGTVGTYAAGDEIDLISSIGEIIDGVPYLQVGVKGIYDRIKLALEGNTEYSFCLAYDNMFSKKVYAYLNGDYVAEIQFEGLGEIPGGGKIIIGQRQGCVGGCFDKNKAFNGRIRNFSIWARLLSIEEIRDIALSNKCPIDDVVDMTPSNVIVHKVK
uniref:uncharacterized protein LOC120336185 n=1 Tax=Styela clava TaxID=7725 RepID=UPI0019395A74|nr:uncharacterized protein LOC120336185 [Styela clava]